MTSRVIIFMRRVKSVTHCYIILEEADRMSEPHWPAGVTVTGAITPEYQTVLTPRRTEFCREVTTHV